MTPKEKIDKPSKKKRKPKPGWSGRHLKVPIKQPQELQHQDEPHDQEHEILEQQQAPEMPNFRPQVVPLA